MKYILDNKEYDVEIIKKRNKKTYVRVKEDLTIHITTNFFATKKEIKNLLDNNHDFLRGAIEKRIKEAEKLGFRKCIIPESNKKLLKDTYKLDIIGVQNISDAMRCLELKK